MKILIDANGRREVSDEEATQILATINNQWTKDAHIVAINSLHDLLFEKTLTDCNYLSMSELALWAQSIDGEYYDEANALLAWYTSTYLTIEVYAESVTEQTAIAPEVFIGNLPVFSFP